MTSIILNRTIPCHLISISLSEEEELFSPLPADLLQTANINDDAITGNIIAAEGRIGFQGALKEFEAGLIKNQHMELLCCEGCIMGPGLSKNGKQYNRRALVSSYANTKMAGA